MSDRVTVEVIRGEWEPAATVEERINWLRDAYRNLEAKLAEARKNSNLERAELEANLIKMQKALASLESFILSENAQSTQVQAIGLSPIAAGIILSGIPELLASVAFVGWLVLIGAIIVTIAALRESVRNEIWDPTVPRNRSK